MERKEFEQYLNDRYFKEIDWYDHKAIVNQKRYKMAQWILIILSAITPILIGIESVSKEKIPWLIWIPLITATIVAVLTSAMKTFKYQENWLNYRTTCETLRKEIHLYNAGIGDYTEVADKEAVFVERVESLISRENTIWLTVQKKKEKSS